MIIKVKKISPYLAIGLISLALFIAIFSFVFQYKKNIMEIRQLSWSEKSMETISTSLKNTVSNLMVEGLRFSGFTEYRDYHKLDEIRFGFLY